MFDEKFEKSEIISNQLLSLAILFPRLFFTMKAIMNLTMRGYYYDATILERTFLENLGLCVYLSKNKLHSDRWLQGKKVETSYIQLFREVYGIFGDMPKDILDKINRQYGITSGHVHSNIGSIIYHFLEITRKPVIVVNLSPSYDKEKIINSITFYAPVFLNKVLIEILKDELSQDYSKRYLELITEQFKTNKKQT